MHPPGKLDTSLQVSLPRHQSTASSRIRPKRFPAFKQHGQRLLTCVFLDTCSTRAAVATFFNFALSASSVSSIWLLESASSTDTAATRTCSPCCAKRNSSKGPLHGRRRMTQQAQERTPMIFPPSAKTTFISCSPPDRSASLEMYAGESSRQKHLIVQRKERQFRGESSFALRHATGNSKPFRVQPAGHGLLQNSAPTVTIESGHRGMRSRCVS